MNELGQSAHLKTPARKQEGRNLLAAALALALATAAGSASAATRVVSNCNDGGSGSLREAVTGAVSGDVVDATGLACSRISLSTGALVVTVGDLKVRGPGRDLLTVTNGAKYGRVIRHEGSGVLNLYGMTISSGVVSPTGNEAGTRGGCIYSNGTVNLGNLFNPADQESGVTVTDCTAVSTESGVEAKGGGIFAKRGAGLASSTVTHARSTAQGQAVRSRGGGIYVENGSFAMKYSEVSDCAAGGAMGVSGGIEAARADQVTVTHSTIAANTATYSVGGAYFGSLTGGLIQIDNSTISDNSAGTFEGGALLNVHSSSAIGAIRIYSSTISGNRSMSSGPSIAAGLEAIGPLTLESTIVSANIRNGLDVDLEQSGGPIDGADNLIGVSLNRPPPPAGLITTTDPKFGPLTNRGGTTRTREPLANSPAIDTGNNRFGASVDQRGPGFGRVLGAGTDIGAFERDPDTNFGNGFD